MSGPNQFIQLSVFDRLDSGSDFGIFGGRVSDIQIVRKSVLRDVENLLNTRRSIIDPPESYHYLNDSMFVYGLEDFVAKNPKSPDVRKALKQSIETTIRKFEPRLMHVLVEFNNEAGNEHNLCFTVKATLNADPVLEPIYFDTWFSVNRGEYKIKNVK
jgi:type VI secretion system protein ImpF